MASDNSTSFAVEKSEVCMLFFLWRIYELVRGSFEKFVEGDSEAERMTDGRRA